MYGYTPLPAIPIVRSLAGKKIEPTSHPSAAEELLLHGLLPPSVALISDWQPRLTHGGGRKRIR